MYIVSYVDYSNHFGSYQSKKMTEEQKNNFLNFVEKFGFDIYDVHVMKKPIKVFFFFLAL